MAATPNPMEEVNALEKRVTALEKGLKESLKREVTLARRIVSMEKALRNLEDGYKRLRVAQST